MSVSAFLLLVFGVCALVVLIWWIMLKALASKQSGHSGPVEIASQRASGRHHGPAYGLQDSHGSWQHGQHESTAAGSEFGQPGALPTDSGEDIRRSAVQGTDAGTHSGFGNENPSPDSSWRSESSSGYDSGSSGSDSSSSSSDSGSSDSGSSSSSD